MEVLETNEENQRDGRESGDISFVELDDYIISPENQIRTIDQITSNQNRITGQIIEQNNE